VGHPKYQVSSEYLPKQGELRVVLRQVQAGEAFPDPIPVTVRTQDGIRDLIMKPNGKEAVATVRLSETAIRSSYLNFNVEVDPRNTVLKEVILKP
jgi:formylmethanofuran dehydrogenase subunit E